MKFIVHLETGKHFTVEADYGRSKDNTHVELLKDNEIVAAFNDVARWGRADAIEEVASPDAG